MHVPSLQDVHDLQPQQAPLSGGAIDETARDLAKLLLTDETLEPMNLPPSYKLSDIGELKTLIATYSTAAQTELSQKSLTPSIQA